MLVPLSWLKEYVDIDVPVSEFAERMIMSGSNIETVKNYAEGVSGLVIGQVVSAEKMEGSDHLNVCMVDVGDAVEGGEPLQIVCGADNVRQPGIKVVVSLPGAILPGGFEIKKTKLRGTVSNGMICSAQELGFEEKSVPVAIRDGIWIMPDDFEVGSDAVKALGLDESVIDFEITPNRPDCLSIIGMAREAAAVFGKELKYPDNTAAAGDVGGTGGATVGANAGDSGTSSLADGTSVASGAGTSAGTGGADSSACANDAADYVDVKIEKPELCRRYVARVCKDIKIEESPFWLQKRLMFAGMRPINNIVDITNYVMLEYGHPIHAFDIRNIEGNTIVVDTAADGDIFTTLDEKERKLSAEMLLINDSKRPVAVAGIMGGLNSEVVEDTETIIVEAANFDADSIRRTSKKLGLRSEASSRFEKGVAAELSGDAADRVCALVSETGAGIVVSGAVDRYPGKIDIPPIRVRCERINALLGTDIPPEGMVEILQRLEMETELNADGHTITVVPPCVRIDLREEIDISEEIARMYGYDELSSTLHADNASASISESWELRALVRNTLVGIGYSEIQTYSFVSPGGVDKVCAPKDSENRAFVRIINPLGEENSVMRTMLIPNLIDVLAHNYNHGNDAVRLFEIGKIFMTDAGAELPKEKLSISMGTFGSGDFFDLKGAAETIFAKLGIKGARYIADEGMGSWHPGRCARVEVTAVKGNRASEVPTMSGSPETSATPQTSAPPTTSVISETPVIIGYIGEVHPDVTKAYGVDVPVYVTEFDFDALVAVSDMARDYTPLRRYPAVTLDISLLADESVTVYDVESIATKNGKDLLEGIKLFDVYRGKQIAEGKKSLSFSLVYRADDRTLTDDEVGKVHAAILKEIAEGTGATLRDI